MMRYRKATATVIDTVLDLKKIRAVLKRWDARIVWESKLKKKVDMILPFPKETNTKVAMES